MIDTPSPILPKLSTAALTILSPSSTESANYKVVFIINGKANK